MLSAELWGKRVHVRTMWRSIAAVSVHNACADTRTQTHRSSRITGILYRKGDREMIDANVLRAVGEVLETHGVTPKSGEGIGDAVARALGLSEGEVHRWVEALSEGCLVEEANRRGGNCQPPGRRPSSGERLPVRSVG